MHSVGALPSAVDKWQVSRPAALLPTWQVASGGGARGGAGALTTGTMFCSARPADGAADMFLVPCMVPWRRHRACSSPPVLVVLIYLVKFGGRSPLTARQMVRLLTGMLEWV